MGFERDPLLKGAALAFRDDAALYAELRQESRGYALVNAKRFELPPGLVQEDRIEDGAALGRFLIKECALSWKLPLAVGLPSSECLFRRVQPTGTTGSPGEVQAWSFPFSRADSLWNTYRCSSANLGFMLVACPKARVVPLLDELHGFRRRLDALEPQIVAGARALTGTDEGSDIFLVIVMGGLVNVVFLHDGDALMFRSFSLPAGESSAGKLDEELRLTRSQIVKDFNMQPSHILLAGDPALATQVPSLSGAVVRRIGDVRRLRFVAPAREDWYDVAGLLLRYADEDFV